MLSESFSKGGTAFATRSFPGTGIRRLFGVSCRLPDAIRGDMSSLRSHGRTVVDASTISSQASRQFIGSPCGAPSNHRGRLSLLLTASPFSQSSRSWLPTSARPDLRVSPFALRSFFNNSTFRLSASSRTFASLRPTAKFHDLARSRVPYPPLRKALFISTHVRAHGLEPIRNFTVTTTPSR